MDNTTNAGGSLNTAATPVTGLGSDRPWFTVMMDGDLVEKQRGSLDASAVLHRLRQAVEYMEAGDGRNAARCTREALAAMAALPRTD